MISLKWLQKNTESYRESLRKRDHLVDLDAILELGAKAKIQQQALEALYQKRNSIAKSNSPLETKKELAQSIKQEIQDITQKATQEQDDLKNMLLSLPNHLHPDTPEGKSASDNRLIAEFDTPKTFSFTPKHHSTLLSFGIDDMAGSELSGSRFSVLRRKAALLEQAVQRFMLQQHIQKGYELISTPVLVKSHTLVNTGQLPKFADDLFQTNSGHWLIPTAEVTLTSLFANKKLTPDLLPIKMTALTNCFRAEAGAAGTQTKGLIRQHQFSKVELVHIEKAERGIDALEEMTLQAESILQALGLPYRKVLLCSGDIGFGASKTYDLEVWMASLNSFVEISSCSLCGPFQAQRMNLSLTEGDVCTLNGSGLAIGRTLAAVAEYYQNADGSVEVPEALKPYMLG